MIVLESVYSMEADFAPLQNIVEIAHESGALIYLDEVHAVGLYGSNAAGVAEQEGVSDQIDIIILDKIQRGERRKDIVEFLTDHYKNDGITTEKANSQAKKKYVEFITTYLKKLWL